MSEISQTIMQSFTNVQHVYEQIANLFSDADDLMQQRGYRILGRSSVEAPFSKSLNYPKWWLVGSAVRHYILDSKPEIARSIGVFFLDGQMLPIEPIIIIAVLKGKMDKETEEVDPTWVLWDVWNKEIDSQSLEVEHHFNEYKNIRQGKIKAIPLEVVQNHELLKTLVIEPLLEID